MLKRCEIIYVKNGWKWRGLTLPGAAKARMSDETYPLFYECVTAARARGYTPPNLRCL